jgi:phospholipid transport system substrate-binding protein
MDKRCFLLPLTALALWVGHVSAAQSPAAVVEQTIRQILQVIDQNRESLKKDPNGLSELIARVALPHFDLDSIARMVVGRSWRSATPGQRQRFLKEFKTFIINSYTNNLIGYSDNDVKIIPPAGLAPALRFVVVRSLVRRKGKAPVTIDYRMHLKGGDWKVYDVIVDGISLVITYRDSFSEKIQTQGLEALIKELSEHNKRFRYGQE